MVADGVFERDENALPMTGSHEGAGTVVTTGQNVTRFNVGDRIMAGLYFHPCEVCKDCQAPKEKSWAQYCPNSGKK